jgi:hypothetical protein
MSRSRTNVINRTDVRFTVPLGAGETPASFVSRLAARYAPSAREFCLDFRTTFQKVVDGDPQAPAIVAAKGGVAPEALSARLGEPAFKRAEPQAQVWQYGGEGCSLFIYFYKTDAGALASSFVDARRTQGGPADPAACLAGVIARKSPPVS